MTLTASPFPLLYSACFALATAVTWNHREDITYYGHRTVREGDALVVACFFATATNVSWTKDGRPLVSVLPNTYTVTQRQEDGYEVSILWVDDAQKVHSGNYSCSDTLSSVHGVVVSEYQDSAQNVAVSDCLHVRPSKPLELSCRTPYEPNASIASWYKDGRPFVPDRRSIFLNSTLIIREARDTDAGTYACTLNPAVKDTRVIYAAALHTVVTPIRIDPFPSVHKVYVGDSVRVSCSARSVPKPNVAWYVGQRKVGDGSAPTAIERPDQGASVSVLSLPSVLLSHDGLYTCVASHRLCDDLVTRRSLQIYVPPIVKTNENYPGVGITLKPSSETLRLHCSYPLLPFARIKWRKDGEDIEYFRGTRKFSTDHKDYSLIIHKPTPEDVGNYTCLVSGTDKKAVILVGLEAKIQDDATPVSARVEGKKLYMRCKVSGLPVPFVRWFKDNTLVKVSQRARFAYKAAAGVFPDTLEIRGLSREDSGTYSCVADNGHSQDLKQFQVDVIGKTAALLPALLICAEVAALVAMVHKVYGQYFDRLKSAEPGGSDHGAEKKEPHGERPEHPECDVVEPVETSADLFEHDGLDSLQHHHVTIPNEVLGSTQFKGAERSMEGDATSTTEDKAKDAGDVTGEMHKESLSDDRGKGKETKSADTVDTAPSYTSYTEPTTEADSSDSQRLGSQKSAKLTSKHYTTSTKKDATSKKTADSLTSDEAYLRGSAEAGARSVPKVIEQQPRAAEVRKKELVKADGLSGARSRTTLQEMKWAPKTDLTPTGRKESAKAKSRALGDTASEDVEQTSAPSEESKKARAPRTTTAEFTLKETLNITRVGLEGSQTPAAEYKAGSAVKVIKEPGKGTPVSTPPKAKTEATVMRRKASKGEAVSLIKADSAEGGLNGAVEHWSVVADGARTNVAGDVPAKPGELPTQETVLETPVRKAVTPVPEVFECSTSKAAVVAPPFTVKRTATAGEAEKAMSEAMLDILKETPSKTYEDYSDQMPSSLTQKTAKESAERETAETVPGILEEPISKAAFRTPPRVVEELAGGTPLEAAEAGSAVKSRGTQTTPQAKEVTETVAKSPPESLTPGGTPALNAVAETIRSALWLPEGAATPPKTDAVVTVQVPPKKASITASVADSRPVQELIIQAAEAPPKTASVVAGIPTCQTGVETPTKRALGATSSAVDRPTADATTHATGDTQAKAAEEVLEPTLEMAAAQPASPGPEGAEEHAAKAEIQAAYAAGSTTEKSGTEAHKPMGSPVAKQIAQTELNAEVQLTAQAASTRVTETRNAESVKLEKSSITVTPKVELRLSVSAGVAVAGGIPEIPTTAEAELKTVSETGAKDTVKRSSVTKSSYEPMAVDKTAQRSAKDSAAEAKPPPTVVPEAVAKETVKPAPVPEKHIEKERPEATDLRRSSMAEEKSKLKVAAESVQRKRKGSVPEVKSPPSATPEAIAKETVKPAPVPKKPLQKAQPETKEVQHPSMAKDSSSLKAAAEEVQRKRKDSVSEAKPSPSATPGTVPKETVKHAPAPETKDVKRRSVAKDKSVLKAAAEEVQRKRKDSVSEAKPSPTATPGTVPKGTVEPPPAPETKDVKRRSVAKDKSVLKAAADLKEKESIAASKPAPSAIPETVAKEMAKPAPTAEALPQKVHPEPKDGKHSSMTKDSSSLKTAEAEAARRKKNGTVTEAKPAPSAIPETVLQGTAEPPPAPERPLQKVHPETKDVKRPSVAKDRLALKVALDRKQKVNVPETKLPPLAVPKAIAKETVKPTPTPQEPLHEAHPEAKGGVKRSSVTKGTLKTAETEAVLRERKKKQALPEVKPASSAISAAARKATAKPEPAPERLPQENKTEAEGPAREVETAKVLPSPVPEATSKEGARPTPEAKAKPEMPAEFTPVVTEDVPMTPAVGKPAALGKRKPSRKKSVDAAAKSKKGSVDASSREPTTVREARKQEGVKTATDAVPATDGQLSRKAPAKAFPEATKTDAAKAAEKTAMPAAEKPQVKAQPEATLKGAAGATLTAPGQTSQGAADEAPVKPTRAPKQAERLVRDTGARPLPKILELLKGVPLRTTKPITKRPEEAALGPMSTRAKESAETAPGTAKLALGVGEERLVVLETMTEPMSIQSADAKTPTPSPPIRGTFEAAAEVPTVQVLPAGTDREKKVPDEEALPIPPPGVTPSGTTADSIMTPTSERGGAATDVVPQITTTTETRTTEMKEQAASASQAEPVLTQASVRTASLAKPSPIFDAMKAPFLKNGKGKDKKDEQTTSAEQQHAKDQDQTTDATAPALVLFDDHAGDWSRTKESNVADTTGDLFGPEESATSVTTQQSSSIPDAYLLEMSTKDTTEPHDRVPTQTETTEVMTVKDVELSTPAKDTAVSKATTDAGTLHDEEVDDSHALVELPCTDVSPGIRSPSQEVMGKMLSQSLLVRFFESGVEEGTHEGEVTPVLERSKIESSKRAHLKRRVRRKLPKVRKHRHHHPHQEGSGEEKETNVERALVPLFDTSSDGVESVCGALVPYVEYEDPVPRAQREGASEPVEDTCTVKLPSESSTSDAGPGALVEYVEHPEGGSACSTSAACCSVDPGAKRSEDSSSSTKPST